MQIESLRYLIELERCGSLSKAARNVFISQQGLGKAIYAMERELGATLIERGPAGVSLTQQGVACVAHAKAICSEYDRMIGAIAESDNPQGSERIPWMITPYIAQTIVSLDDENRDFSLFGAKEISFAKGVAELLQNDRYRVLTAEVFPWTQRDLEQQGLAFEPFLNVSIGLLWERGSQPEPKLPLRLADFTDLPLVMYSDSSMDALLEKAFADNPLRNIQSTFGNHASVRAFVQSQAVYGLSDTLAYSFLRNQKTSEGTELCFAPLNDNRATFQVGFLYRKDDELTKSHRMIMNSARAEYSRQRY